HASWTSCASHHGEVRGASRQARGYTDVDLHSALKGGDPACHAALPRDFGWVPASPRCARADPGLTCALQAVTASPAALATLTAALMSRSSSVPHAPH